VIRLSIPVRQALEKLTLPVLVAAAFALMLIGKADTLLAERARTALADALAPIYAALAQPLATARAVGADARNLFALQAENARLRAENARLRRWQAAAIALESQNAALKAELHWLPTPTPRYVTAPVIADAGGIYARSVLLAVGPGQRVKRGEVALDDRGLVGRITEVGARSARVLLITDLNSRIPVILEGSHERALLVGTNGPEPVLRFWPTGQPPAEGERVVTSAEANAFPAGLPVGTVHYTARNTAEVIPAAGLDRLEMVRLFDYGLTGLQPPDGAARRQRPG